MTLETIIEAAVERAVERVLDRKLKAQAAPAELLPVEEAAKLAHVSEATIRRWVDDEVLTRYGSAHALRIRRDELLNVKPKPSDKTADDVVAAILGKKR